LSISNEEAEKVKELLDRGLSHYKISAILNINRVKIWRNVQIMGIKKVRKVQKTSSGAYFNWKDFDNSVI